MSTYHTLCFNEIIFNSLDTGLPSILIEAILPFLGGKGGDKKATTE